MIPLYTRALFRVPLDFSDTRMDKGSIFPLFDGEGTVHKLCIVEEETAQIFATPWRPKLVGKPLFRPIRLDLSYSALEDLTAREGYEVTGWWHYDPLWLFSEEHLKNHPATPPIKLTNAANELKDIVSLSFSRDLSRVKWMTKIVPEGKQLLPYDPTVLPPRTESPEEAVSDVGWRLRPFWEK